MKLSKLRELLENKDISQEEFDAMLKTAEDDTKPDESQTQEQPGQYTKEEVDKLIQQAIDRTANKFGNVNKTLKEELDKLKKEKLTDEERRALEDKEKAEELSKREHEVLDKENRFYAIKAIKDIGLDDGSSNALDLVDFVMDSDTDGIDKKVKALDTLIRKMVKSEVDKTFKEHGGTPGKGGSAGGSKGNPWMKDQWNVTKQMKLEVEDPQEAKRLKSEAGVK